MGVDIGGGAKKAEACLESVGIGFMFAPNFHPAMKHVMPVRHEMGIRTVFNLLGPLSSPANVDIHLMGVFDPKYVEIMARVLQNLGVKRAMVVHGFDNRGEIAMDEISTIGKTRAAILDGGEINIFDLSPKDFGFEKVDEEFIRAPGTLEENLQIAQDVLHGRNGNPAQKARMELCLANASAIIFLAGKVATFKEGVEMARDAVECGIALQKLEEFVQMSKEVSEI
jgi:anthranilate phosphoribosyltransferase